MQVRGKPGSGDPKDKTPMKWVEAWAEPWINIVVVVTDTENDLQTRSLNRIRAGQMGLGSFQQPTS